MSYFLTSLFADISSYLEPVLAKCSFFSYWILWQPCLWEHGAEYMASVKAGSTWLNSF